MTVKSDGFVSRLRKIIGQNFVSGESDRGNWAKDNEYQAVRAEFKGNYPLETDGSVKEPFVIGPENVEQVVDEELDHPQLTTLHRIGLHLQKRRSPGAMAQEVVRILASTLDYERSAILLVDKNARQLKPFALSEKGYGTDFSQAHKRFAALHDLRVGAGIPGVVAQDGRSVCTGDVQSESRFGEVPPEIQSAVCVPIRIDGVVIGVINVDSDRLNAFTAMDHQVLEIVAGQIAVAIQNAHLYSQVGQITGSEKTKNAYESVPDTRSGNLPERLSGDELLDSEARFRAIVKELQAQNEELNAFNHTVAHDLKNPLSILLGFSEVLVQDYGGGEDEVLDQGIRVILENARRIENIINELLLLAEVRQLDEITVETLDTASTVVEVRNRLSNLITEYEAKIIVPAAWPSAKGYRPWVEEIWVNYLSNAIKYGGSPPKVELGAMVQSDGMVRFWVRDNGAGISSEDQKLLFVPFTKLKQVNTTGHGLGLSIVQRITKKLGGTVGVDSEPGMGSLFWFTLPMAELSVNRRP